MAYLHAHWRGVAQGIRFRHASLPPSSFFPSPPFFTSSSSSSSSFLFLPFFPLLPPDQLSAVGLSHSTKKTTQNFTLVQSEQHSNSSTATIGRHGNTTRADCQPVVGARVPTRGRPSDYGSDWSGEGETTGRTGTHCIRGKSDKV